MCIRKRISGEKKTDPLYCNIHIQASFAMKANVVHLLVSTFNTIYDKS